MLVDQTYPDGADAYVRDLKNDPIIMFQHKYYVPIAVFMCFFFPMLIGWTLELSFGGLAVAGFLRLAVVHHATFLINSGVTRSVKNFTNEHTGKDSPFIAFFTFGEGYHNFHHTFANDYRNGIRWYHWDPTKWMIKFCATLGLTTNLRVTSPEAILAARMHMDESKIKERLSHRWEAAFEERIAHLKERVSRRKRSGCL